MTIQQDVKDHHAKNDAELRKLGEFATPVQKDKHKWEHRFLTAAQYIGIAIAGATVGKVAGSAISRQFEYVADKAGAELTSPEAMISALHRLEPVLEATYSKMPAEAQNYIKNFHQPIFGNHPSIEQRVTALRL